jgi:hypothetical protein
LIFCKITPRITNRITGKVALIVARICIWSGPYIKTDYGKILTGSYLVL